MNYKETTQQHSLYNRNITRWEYYYNSYYGGQDYQTAGYLRKYLDEELDGNNEYIKRISATPLDNHCKNVVDTYTSFIWRVTPTRDLGNLKDSPAVSSFVKDADLEGRSFDAVMRQSTSLANIYGHVLLIIDKPVSEAKNLAEELAEGIRPYLSVFTPENIIDWTTTKQANGSFGLSMLKLCEYKDEYVSHYRIWTPESITIIETDNEKEKSVVIDVLPNHLGVIPATYVYAQRSHHRGIGISQINDIADVQRSIYNELSELEQIIRLSNHPTLVATDGIDVSAGAGGTISIDDDSDPGLKPYLLQPSGASIASVIQSIEMKVAMISTMANLSSMRTTTTSSASGIALKTERELLNVTLAQMADNLELAEEQIWKLFGKFYDIDFDGSINYPDSFDINDSVVDFNFLMSAQGAAMSSAKYRKEVEKQIAMIVIDDDESLSAILKEIDDGPEQI